MKIHCLARRYLPAENCLAMKALSSGILESHLVGGFCNCCDHPRLACDRIVDVCVRGIFHGKYDNGVMVAVAGLNHASPCLETISLGRPLSLFKRFQNPLHVVPAVFGEQAART